MVVAPGTLTAAAQLPPVSPPFVASLPDLGRALRAVAGAGYARVGAAVDRATVARLLRERDARAMRDVPEVVGPVRQRARQLTVSTTHPAYPAVTALAEALRAAVTAHADDLPGLALYAPNEATYMAYRGQGCGITPHRDGRRHALLICVFTLCGSAPFSIVADRAGAHVVDRWDTTPGDLCLLRGPGFSREDDGRPLHSVGAPAGEGERVSLSLRMNTQAPE